MENISEGKRLTTEELDELIALLESLEATASGGQTEPAAHLARVKELSLALARYVRKDRDKLDYKEVLDHMEDSIYVTDKDGVAVYVNPAYVKNLGIQPEQVLGRSITDIIKEGELFKIAVTPEVLARKTSVKKIANYPMRGRQHIGVMYGNPIFDGSGEIKNVVVSSMGFEKVQMTYDEFKSKNLQESPAVRIAADDSTAHKIPMIGTSHQYMDIKSIIAKVADTDATVLITGESGVGKEVVADRIQYSGKRREKSYIKVNCAAIPKHLLESELFGYEKGSFTGADPKGKPGLFELANQGTIMLDEIGDMPLELQTRLLRVIQQKEVMRLGGVKAIPLDIRIIAATNCDLKQKVKEGNFRQDLYYRLSVVPIYVPALRERREDVKELVEFFLEKYNGNYSKNVYLTASQMDLFHSYNWPGNIRELQNMVEYLVIFSEDDRISEEILSHVFDEGSTVRKAPKAGLYEALQQYEEALIRDAIQATGGIRKAAAYLKVNPSTISRKAKSYGIKEE